MDRPRFDASQRPEPLVVRASMRNGLTLGVVGVGSSAFLVWVMSTGFFTDPGDPSSLGGPAQLASVAWIAFFGTTGLWFLVRSLLRVPVLRVDERGVRTSWSWGAAGLTPWEEVRGIEARGQYVAVDVENPVAPFRRTPGLRHGTLRRQQDEAGSPVAIWRDMLPDVEHAITTMRHWRAHVTWRQRRGSRD